MSDKPIRHHRLKANSLGFTLLELLIALSIFALIAAMAYGGLATVLELSAHTQQQAQQWKKIQLTFARLQQDVEHFIPRPIRDSYGDPQAALWIDSIGITWTRGGWLNPLHQARSDLQRVRYRYHEQALWRDHWVVLDQAQDSQAHSVLMLDDVKQIKWQFLDAHHVWHDVWPPTDNLSSARRANAKTENEQQNESINEPIIDPPSLLAIAITITLPRFGELTRLMAVVNDAI